MEHKKNKFKQPSFIEILLFSHDVTSATTYVCYAHKLFGYDGNIISMHLTRVNIVIIEDKTSFLI